MGNLDPRLVRAGAAYLVVLVFLVLAAQLGVVPGSHERPAETGGVADNPYRAVMLAAVIGFAVSLGALTSWAGRVLEGWHLGLALLIVGGVITGTGLALAPAILFPNDQYPVTFSWLLLGAPTGFVTWLACTVAMRGAPAEPAMPG